MVFPIEGTWNIYRYPNEAEINLGRTDCDMVWISAADTARKAIAILKLKRISGQVQYGIKGGVTNVVFIQIV
jgi:hypothetical protein